MPGYVTLIGLEIDGAFTAYNGIVFTASGSLTVTNCVIQSFLDFNELGGNGILITPPSGGGLSQVFVTNTVVANNGNAGLTTSLRAAIHQPPLSSTISSRTTTTIMESPSIQQTAAVRPSLKYPTASRATTRPGEFSLRREHGFQLKIRRSLATLATACLSPERRVFRLFRSITVTSAATGAPALPQPATPKCCLVAVR